MVEWLPIAPEDWQSTAPVVDKDAGIEALFWRVHVTDETQSGEVRRNYFNYVRLKVFNEKGKATAATLEIPMDRDVGIPFLSGRTVKPDGTILELKKDAIFEREVERAGGSRRKVKSFAMPGVEPGVILEYRWQEVRWTGHYINTYIRMPFQREYPVRKVTYFVKPLPRDQIADGLGMAIAAFNCATSPLKEEPNGYNSLSVEKIPAYQPEPYSPSAPTIQPWALAFYTDPRTREPEAYWDDIGRKEYRRIHQTLKPSDEMKKAAAEATSGAKSDEEKVVGLLRYLRAHLTDLWDSKVDRATRNAVLEKIGKGPRTTADVFKSGIGTADEMNGVFAAMAGTLGLEARPALVASKNEMTFRPQMMTRYFLNHVDMAVKLGDQWRVFDVSTRRLPPDMLSWTEEGVYALISDPKKPVFIETPTAEPSRSQSAR